MGFNYQAHGNKLKKWEKQKQTRLAGWKVNWPSETWREFAENESEDDHIETPPAKPVKSMIEALVPSVRDTAVDREVIKDR